MLHETIYHTGVERVELVLASGLVDHPQDLADMGVALLLTEGAVLRHGVQTEQIEPDAVGHDVLALHQGQLTLGVAIVGVLVQGTVAAQVLVETDADGVVAHNHALVERADLRIDLGRLEAGDMLTQELEGRCERLVDILHIGILLLRLGNERLERGVLIETQKLGVDLLIVDLTDAQHILYQRARLLRIDRVHLLQGREIARGEIEALDAIIAIDNHLMVVVGHELPFAADAAEHHNQ